MNIPATGALLVYRCSSCRGDHCFAPWAGGDHFLCPRTQTRVDLIDEITEVSEAGAVADRLAAAGAEIERLNVELTRRTMHHQKEKEQYQREREVWAAKKRDHVEHVQRLKIERDQAQAFKVYVHQRLDAAGVPFNPEPETNAKHGCRIEGRLNWLIHGRDAQRKMNEATHAAYHDVSSACLLPLADEIILAIREVRPSDREKSGPDPAPATAAVNSPKKEEPGSA